MFNKKTSNKNKWGIMLMRQIKFNNLLVISTLFLITSCASTHPVNDPIEPVNRVFYKFNDTLDGYILKPLAKGYDTVTPTFARTGVDNFFSNLRYPIVFVNQFLQGKVKLGLQDTGRFLVNTTFGLAGLVDVAENFGLEEHDEDFGQTFGFWGMGSGPYIVLPIFGPSNVRDSIGLVADSYTDPLNYEYFDDHRAIKNRTLALDLIEKRAQILKSEKLIVGDRYTFIRDAYMQKRESLILDGAVSEDDPFLDDEE